MKTLQALLEARDALIAKNTAICDAAEAAERGFGDDERTALDANKAEIEGLDVDIAQAQEDEGRREFSRTAQAGQNAGRGRKTSLHSPALAEAAGIATVIEVGQNLLEKDPKKGYEHPRQFLADVAAMGLKRPTRTMFNPDAIQYLMGRNHETEIGATAGSDEAGTYSDAYGGFLVPEGFSPNMLKLDPEPDPTAALTTKIPMESPSIPIPARVDKDHSTSVTGGFTVTRKAETAAATASRMQVEQIKLQANSLFGFSYATEEILTDSLISFVSMIASSFSEEFTSVILQERLNGTGVGEYLGVLNSPALITVAKEDGQAANTLRHANILKMRSRAWGYENAIWMANHDTIPKLGTLNEAVGTGGQLLWQTDARQDIPDSLMGRPLVFSEYVATLGDANDIILVNWKEYLEGLLQPLQSAESIHVRFAEHERAFKFWMRNAGLPWWTSVLTPLNGATRSPIVGLAARV